MLMKLFLHKYIPEFLEHIAWFVLYLEGNKSRAWITGADELSRIIRHDTVQIKVMN